MEKGQSIVNVRVVDPANLLAPGFAQALAMLTLGARLDPMVNGGDVVEFRELVRGEMERRFEFVFDPAKKVEGVEISEWQRRWEDAAWLAANPESPLAWLRRFADNYGRFAGWMKVHDAVLVFRNPQSGEQERVAYVPESLIDTDRGREILRGAGLPA